MQLAVAEFDNHGTFRMLRQVRVPLVLILILIPCYQTNLPIRLGPNRLQGRNVQ
jgi:hypothetical protein